jgi:signal transduction histidine kinase
MKIRTRLVFWYFFASFILLLIFSIGTYWGMRHLLFNSLDEDLNRVKDDIVESYNPETNSFKVFEHPYYLEAELSTFYLILYDSSDKIIYKSDIVDKLNLHLPLINSDTTYIATAKILNQPSSFKTKNNETQFRVIGRTIIRDSNIIGYLVIGEPFEKIYESMDKLLEVLLFGIGFATLMIFILAYFLTERSLQPIEDLIDQTSKISHQNLNERLDIQNSEDEIGKLTGVLNDLLKRLQDAFEKQQEFMADAAHELKTPLTVLRTHWEDELNNKDIPENFKLKLVQDIETITRLSKLINNLLLLTNSEYSQLRKEFEKFDLTEMIKDVVTNSAILAELKNQTLTFNEASSIFINGDRNRLYQLFFNLIDNAIKYTQDSGRINISLKSENKLVVIKIDDNGIGIPSEDIPFIFERFYRVHKDRSKKWGGNGLGLAIAKLITQIHEGEISVESRVGEGSSFIVKIPALK